MRCPVCDSNSRYFFRNRETKRPFFRCEKCLYTFSTEQKPNFEEAKGFFKAQWEESPDGGCPDSYPLFYALLESVGRPSLKALDFGCGNGEFIRFLRNKGIETLGVDPIPVENDMKPYVYSTLDELPEKRFDVITAFEVFEHLDRPRDTLSQLLPFLDQNGFVFIATTLTNRALTNTRCIPYWLYQKDATHIGFFHERTFEWLAARFNLEIHILRHCFVVLDKSSQRLIDVDPQGTKFIFRKEEHSYLARRPGPF